jgi:hypothetical protein
MEWVLVFLVPFIYQCEKELQYYCPGRTFPTLTSTTSPPSTTGFSTRSTYKVTYLTIKRTATTRSMDNLYKLIIHYKMAYHQNTFYKLPLLCCICILNTQIKWILVPVADISQIAAYRLYFSWQHILGFSVL